jgi:hypothetical protein
MLGKYPINKLFKFVVIHLNKNKYMINLFNKIMGLILFIILILSLTFNKLL